MQYKLFQLKKQARTVLREIAWTGVDTIPTPVGSSVMTASAKYKEIKGKEISSSISLWSWTKLNKLGLNSTNKCQTYRGDLLSPSSLVVLSVLVLSFLSSKSTWLTSSYSLAFPWLMVVEGSYLAHPQDAVGAPGLTAGSTRSYLALAPLGQSPGPGCTHSCHLWEKGGRL